MLFVLHAQPSAYAAPTGPRAHVWTLAPADWNAAGHAGAAHAYTSPALRAPSPFTAAGVDWRAALPLGARVEIALRLSRDGQTWQAWQPIHPEAQGEQWFGENLVTLDGAQWVQARLTLHGEARVTALTLTAIDASAAPTLAAARAHTAPLAAPAPAIIPRTAWGADESVMTWPPAYAPAHKIILHHTVTSGGANPVAEVQAIYYYHAVTRGWGDIGYNYLVDKFGNIYEGRAGGPDVIAGHTYGYNTGSVGIGNLGDYTTLEPGDAMREANVALAAWFGGRNYIHPLEISPFNDRFTFNIAGHRDYAATACPGDAFYPLLPAIREATWTRIALYTPAYAAAFLEHTTPPRMLAGRTHAMQLTLRNSGTHTWYRLSDPDSGTPYHLGYHWYDALGQHYVQPPEEDHRTPLLGDVSFGARATFGEALLTAPHTPGVYTLTWDMVHEGVTWFASQGSPTLDVSITVTHPATLTGILHDNRGVGVSGARVTLSDGSRTLSGADGRYTLRDIFPGSYTLQAHEPGRHHFPNGTPVNLTLHAQTPASVTLALVPFDNAIRNWDFEAGLAHWAAHGDAGAVARASAAAHSGQGSAELSAPGGQWIALQQTLTLPQDVVSPTLALFARGDALHVLIETPSGTMTHTLPASPDWRHGWAAVDATPGTPVTITLHLRAAAQPATAFIDEVTLGSGGAGGWRYRHIYLPAVLRAP